LKAQPKAPSTSGDADSTPVPRLAGEAALTAGGRNGHGTNSNAVLVGLSGTQNGTFNLLFI
jgi:hypothetical protein